MNKSKGNPRSWIDLDIHLIKQNPEKQDCVPISLKMMMDFISRWDEDMPEMSASRIAEALNTDEELGTSLFDITNLNEILDDENCGWRIEIEERGDLERVLDDLERSLPTGVYIDKRFDLEGVSGILHHAIVVRGYDPKLKHIRCMDPLEEGVKEYPEVDFLRLWERGSGIVLRWIKSTRQPKLTDWSKNNDIIEDSDSN